MAMMRWLGCVLGCALAACGSEEPSDESGVGGSDGAGGTGTGTGACNVRLVTSPPASAAHVDQCTELDFDTDPPSGGTHYDVWAAFQNYAFPVPHGYLVHSLEHGAVVFWYNCPEGCADEVAEVEAFIDARPADVACAGRGAERRAILTPSPTLGSRWAASAWGFALTADCFDDEAFEDFYADHYGRAPEDFCAPGQAFTADPCL
jgi:hypothetical protein